MVANNVRQFGSATRTGSDEGEADEPYVVDICGREIVLNSPGSGPLAYFTMIIGGSDEDIVRFGQALNFVVSMMSDDDGRYVKRCMLDDTLQAEEIFDLVEGAVEHWSARPTKRSSTSSRRQPSSGKTSTASSPRKASTRSRSRSEGSQT